MIRTPKDTYYSRYKFVIVSGGIGAAFRLAYYLCAGRVVILQAYKYEECLQALGAFYSRLRRFGI